MRLRLGLSDQGVKPKVGLKSETSNSGPSLKGDFQNKTVVDKSKEASNTQKSKVSSEISKKQSYRCRFCPSTDHTSSKCPSYVTLEAKKARASSLGLCSRCLNKNHNASECPGLKAALPYKCNVCRKPEHHGALCPHASGDDKKMLNIGSVLDVIVPIVSACM